MTIRQRFLVGMLGAVLLLPAPGAAQANYSVGCSPGIPSCASLRFFIAATGGGYGINELYIELLSTSWQFAGGPVGTYSAEDSFGPFAGFTTIGPGGVNIFIDFLENGFPFELFGSDVGYIDLEAMGPGHADNLWFNVTGVDINGNPINVSVTPEPVTLTLLGSGLAALAAARHRRRKRSESC